VKFTTCSGVASSSRFPCCTQLCAAHGVVPTQGEVPSATAVADAVWGPWRRLGLDVGLLGGVVVTPTCGLAGASPTAARAVVAACRQGAAALAERAADG